ncbi:MAG: hypothetical protein H0U52_08040 [Chloroflexi bacterium]|nr:hypothetical protein [Chloroflexota bacterium]
MLGIAGVGVVTLRAGEDQLGGVLVLAPPLMLVGWIASWLMLGLGWTLVGYALLIRPNPGDPLPAGRG